MQLSYRLAHPAIESTEDAEALMLVTLMAPVGTTQRRPVNLAVAIDRSGSMSGAPLAIAKAALSQFVDQLLPTDRLTIVAFDDHATPIISGQTATDKAALRAAINAIGTGGMTNLSAGWLMAADLVAKHADPGTYSRIVLLGDGVANAGITDADQLATIATGLSARGIPTTAIGIGSGYDDALLALIAAQSGGNLHHLDGVDGVGMLLKKEFEELIALYAQNLTLHIAPDVNVRECVVLNGYPVSASAHGLDVACGDIVMGDEKYILVRFRLGANVGTQALTALTLGYHQVAGDVAFRELVGFVNVNRHDIVDSTPIDAIVASHLTIVKAATARRAAADMADRGDISGASFLLRDAESEARAAGLTSEADDLSSTRRALENDVAMISKRMKSQSSSRSRYRKFS